MNMTREEAKKCVGEGWSKIIDEIYDILPEDAHIAQVKEKLGGLRFYVNNVSQEVHDFIWAKETESMHVCEMCGKRGKVRPLGWIKTLCDVHYEEIKLEDEKKRKK